MCVCVLGGKKCQSFGKVCVRTEWMVPIKKIYKNQKVFSIVSNTIWIEKCNCKCMIPKANQQTILQH